MKILHVIPSVSLAHGGPSRAIRLIAQALTARGVEVEIATTDDDGPGQRFSPSRPPPQVGEKKTFPTPTLPTSGEGVFLGGFISSPTCGGGWEGDALVRFFPKRTEFYKISPAFARWIFRHVRDYDVVHIHALFSFTSIAAAWAARWAGVPYVVRPLGTLNQYGVTQRRPWLKRLSLKFIEGPILRHAAAVHFTALAEQREAEGLGVGMNGVVIPLGVEPFSPSQPPPQVGEEQTIPTPARPMTGLHASPVSAGQSQAVGFACSASTPTGGEGVFIGGFISSPTCGGGREGDTLFTQFPQLANQRIVLFLSRLDPKKNIEGLLRAFALLGAGRENHLPQLLIAGGGAPDYVSTLKTLADSLGLADRVTWTGNLEGELKAAALAAADVFVLPSFSENFGIAAAEALLAGLPCVLGEGVAIADEVQQAGAGLAVAPDAQSIAAALQTLLADEPLRAAMAQKAVALAREKYSVDAMGSALVRLYSKIISQRNAGALD